VRPALEGAARRYARALLDVALETGDPSRLREELRTVAGLLRDQRTLALALGHPAFRAERRRALVRALLHGSGASDLLGRLMDLLADRGRLALLPRIAVAYEEAFNLQRGVVTAEAVTAQALGADERERLAAALRAASGREVELTTRVDPATLGGVLVRMGGKTYDGTVRRQLARLRERLVLGTEGA
jgi:F-type H+-transporting ATPase subunit delta